MARVRGPGRRAAVVLISALAVAGCGPSGPSELVVHNRTLVPISVRDAAQNSIEPCGSATFGWEDWALRWAPLAGSRPVDPKAVSIDVYAKPIEGPLHAVVIVTEEGSRIYSPGEVPSLPPCSGSPPPVPSLQG